MGWREASQPGARRRTPHEIAGGKLMAVPRTIKGARPLALRARGDFAGLPASAGTTRRPRRRLMVPFFIQIKCHLGKSYEVANKLADAEIASEIYSTAGDYDLLVKFYVEDATDIGHFVNEKVQVIPGIQDTRTIITFKAFG